MRVLERKSGKINGENMAKMKKSVTMSDIAERLEVSTVTVSKALSGQKGVSEEMREKIKELAEEMGVEVCDCYSEWKKLSETQDTTMLLVNRINHPIAQMHQLFADALFKIIFKEKPDLIPENSSTMYSGENENTD